MENTKKLAVIGNPIEHSFSPRLHNYISKKMGLNYQYEARLVEKKNFTKTIDKLIKRSDKKKCNKKKTNMEDIAEIVNDDESEEEFNNLKKHIQDEPKLAFGKKHDWGKDNPLEEENDLSISESDIKEWDELFG